MNVVPPDCPTESNHRHTVFLDLFDSGRLYVVSHTPHNIVVGGGMLRTSVDDGRFRCFSQRTESFRVSQNDR
jgi:hypothetical protein